MDFSTSEEQSMLADSVARFIDNDYPFDRRQEIAAGQKGYSEETWRAFADLGFTSVLFDEADGGLNGGPVELMLIMEQFGRGLVVEPFLATVVLSGGILQRLARPVQKKRWLAPIISGEIQAALAFAESQGRFDPADIATRARRDGDAFVLDGQKTFVLHGGDADLLLIPARTDGEQRARQGITLFALPGDTHGIERQPYPTVDGQRAAEIRLAGVRAGRDSVLGEIGAGFHALQATIDLATLAVSAEAVGVLETLHSRTVDYTKSRVQFGVPIGSFQALQHRMVDMLVDCQQIRSLLLWAAMTAASGDPETPAAISAVKYRVGTTGRRVAQEAVQMHGGMGVTWELDIAHYFKRLSAIEVLFGNSDYHLDRFIELSDEAGRTWRGQSRPA
jgi:alkylation response protein AidB-like acyl-CoA dehydrogenase